MDGIEPSRNTTKKVVLNHKSVKAHTCNILERREREDATKIRKEAVYVLVK